MPLYGSASRVPGQKHTKFRFTSISGGVNLSGHMVVVLCYLEANPPGLFDDRERSEDH